MKQLKDVIARKRPLSLSNAPGAPEQEEPVQDFGRIAAVRNSQRPRPMPGDAEVPDDAESVAETSIVDPAAPRAKQIWDIETQDADAPLGISDAEPTPKTDNMPERARVEREVQKQPSEGDRTRVKTRILGLHTEALDEDVFDAAQGNPSEKSQFPAGWLVLVEGPGRGMSFAVSAGVSTIGRSTDQTICLDYGDTSISRQAHASVAYDEEQNLFFIGHGGKSNIVRRNDNPILSTEPLVDGDLIRVGKTTLRFVALCGPNFTWRISEQEEDDTDV